MLGSITEGPKDAPHPSSLWFLQAQERFEAGANPFLKDLIGWDRP
jgi:hypothetical protein